MHLIPYEMNGLKKKSIFLKIRKWPKVITSKIERAMVDYREYRPVRDKNVPYVTAYLYSRLIFLKKKIGQGEQVHMDTQNQYEVEP